MIARASGALLFSYLIVTVAGGVFLFLPSPVLSEVTQYSATLILWALFYLAGGGLAALCVVVRKYVENTIPLWYFEVAGLSLIIAANLVYAYAVIQASLFIGDSNVIALALILIAFSGGLVARTIETLRFVQFFKKYAASERER